jgi:hypothetical protein
MPRRTLSPRISVTVMRVLSPTVIACPTFLVSTNIQTSRHTHLEIGKSWLFLWEILEDRRRDGSLVPDRTGDVVQMSQAACGERGTEASSVHTLHGLLIV